MKRVALLLFWPAVCAFGVGAGSLSSGRLRDYFRNLANQFQHGGVGSTCRA